MNETAVIDVSGLVKRFDDITAVNGFSIQVRRGEICGFLGPNGSGKTTTLRMLCGLLTPDAGSGTCLGYDVLHESIKIKSEIGYMTQRFSLYEDLTIAENIDFVARIHRVPKRKAVVSDALDGLGLTERADQLAGTLSGGWKQRLSLACCTLHKPELLLLDEPTAGVDPKARREFWDEIHKLARGGLTVLVSTHYMDEAERCHRIAYLAWGELMSVGTQAEIIANTRLTTCVVTGPGLESLSQRLVNTPDIDMVAHFGASLHISGKDAEALEAAIAPWRNDPELDWQSGKPSLEDAFIQLMQRMPEGK
ncbi:MAG: ABC transporter ATP-binding protein [Pseudomonadota bacterium]|nr:ABC transporter ATP-binding protein [Pseudomonadota bacterium]